MKFDKIIMNPPYGPIALKILEEMQKHIVNKQNIISLQPIDRWQKAKLFSMDSPIDGTCVVERIPMKNAIELFGTNQRTDLGLISFNRKEANDIIQNASLLKKIVTRLNDIKGDLLYDHLKLDIPKIGIKFGYNCTISGNGGNGRECYNICSRNPQTAFKMEKIGHVKYLNCSNENERESIHKFYINIVLRYIYKELGFGGIPYSIIPWIQQFVNPRTGKKGYESEWTNEDFYKFFNIIEDEQKIIEETMEKYK